jgi:hypothetical protein
MAPSRAQPRVSLRSDVFLCKDRFILVVWSVNDTLKNILFYSMLPSPYVGAVRAWLHVLPNMPAAGGRSEPVRDGLIAPHEQVIFAPPPSQTMIPIRDIARHARVP